MIHFSKMQGTGNDFVVIADFDDLLDISPEATKALCDRHFGIGADGLIRITRSESHHFFMDYRNSDGSIAEMCANGVRATGKFLGDRGLTTNALDLETRAGVKSLEFERGPDARVSAVRVNMGRPEFPAEVTEKLEVLGEMIEISAVSMGNPHAVVFVDDLDRVDLALVGPAMQAVDRFPEGVNVSFATVVSRGVIRTRVWERGSAETLCCGSAACAVASAAKRRDMCDDSLTAFMPGGELKFELGTGDVIMTGPAADVFSGTFDPRCFGVSCAG